MDYSNHQIFKHNTPVSQPAAKARGRLKYRLCVNQKRGATSDREQVAATAAAQDAIRLRLGGAPLLSSSVSVSLPIRLSPLSFFPFLCPLNDASISLGKPLRLIFVTEIMTIYIIQPA